MLSQSAYAYDYKAEIPPKADNMNVYSSFEENMSTGLAAKTGSPIVYMNNKKEIYPNALIEENGCKYLSLQLFSDVFAAVTEFSGDDITLFMGAYELAMTVGDREITVKYENQFKTELESAVLNKNGAVYVPADSFCSVLNKHVYEQGDILFISEQNDAVTEYTDELERLFEETSAGGTVRIYAKPNGINGDGTINSPCSGLENVRNAARKYINKDMDYDIEIILAGGRYELSDTFWLTEKDSGYNHHTVTYKSADGERAEITGSKKINSWENYSGSIRRADIGGNTNLIVYEDDKRAAEARYPNSGWLYMQSNSGDLNYSFKFRDDGIPAAENIDIMKVCYWASDCFVYYNDIESIDYETKTIKTKQSIRGTGYDNVRYFLCGAMEYLDSPGEFYNGKDGILYYIPVSDEGNVEVTVCSRNLIEIHGSSDTAPAKNIVFDGVTVKNSAFGRSLIRMENARNITVRNCILKNSGQEGIDIAYWAKNNIVENNRISNIGHTGVMIYGKYARTYAVNSGNRIINNEISDVGELKGDGSCVNVFESRSNIIRNNKLYNSGRYCISMSGFDIYSWDGKKDLINPEPVYENRNCYSHTNDNIIAYNDCFGASADSSDTAAINLWNTDPGNIVYSNYVHDCSSPFGFYFGIYVDDRCENTLIRKNIVKGLKEENGALDAVIMVKGLYNRVENNIFVNNSPRRGVFQNYNDADTDKYKTSKNNVFYNSGENLYHFTSWNTDKMQYSDRNIYFNDSGVYNVFGIESQPTSFEKWSQISDGKYDNLSLRENPLFYDEENDDYRFSYNSPVYRLGIDDVNFEQIGLCEDYAFADSDNTAEKLYIVSKDGRYAKSFVNLDAGDEFGFKVMARTRGGYLKEVKDARISTDNNQAAEVQYGSIKALSDGTAKIYAVYGDAKTSADVFVGDKIADIGISLPDELRLRNSYDYYVYGITEYGRKVMLDNAEIAVDDKIEQVGDCFKAVKQGNSVIKVSYKGICREFSVNISYGDEHMKNGDFEFMDMSWSLPEVFSISGNDKSSGEYSLKLEGEGKYMCARTVHNVKPDTDYYLSFDYRRIEYRAGKTAVIKVFSGDNETKDNLIGSYEITGEETDWSHVNIAFNSGSTDIVRIIIVDNGIRCFLDNFKCARRLYSQITNGDFSMGNTGWDFSKTCTVTENDSMRYVLMKGGRSQGIMTSKPYVNVMKDTDYVLEFDAYNIKNGTGYTSVNAYGNGMDNNRIFRRDLPESEEMTHYEIEFSSGNFECIKFTAFAEGGAEAGIANLRLRLKEPAKPNYKTYLSGENAVLEYTNPTDEKQDGVIWYAAYYDENGRFINVIKNECEFDKWESGRYEMVTGGGEIKLFLWDRLMRPLV